MNDFMKDFFGNKSKRNNPETKYSVNHDKWDKKRLDQVHDEVKDFVLANKELGKKVNTGIEAMSDTFYSLLKSVPTLKDPKEIRPSYMTNRVVLDEMMKLKEYDELRQISTGDPIGAALACVAMEPELEILFDKLSEEQKASEQLESQMQQAESLMDESSNIEELLSSALSDGNSEEAKNYQDQLATMQEQMKMLQEQIESGTEELQELLDSKSSSIKNSVKEAVNKAIDESATGFDGWGLQPGGLKKLNAKTRIELAKKLNSSKFKKMSEIIGRVQRSAIAEQHNKVEQAQEEIYDLEIGSDIARVLPTEMMMLNDEVLVLDWMRKYAENSLIQYALEGTDKLSKGSIMILEDGSSSMSGEREIWAKAIGLALLKIATIQKRPFFAIHFGGTGEYKTFDYDTSGKTLKCKTFYKGKINNLEGIDSILEYAECFFSGGTDFVTPLSIALEKFKEEYSAKSMVHGDIVFLTDGQCGVLPDFIKKFKQAQSDLGFKVFGISIGGNPNSEPLATICDSVISPKNLIDAEDVKGIFNAI